MAAAVSSVANGGQLIEPRLVRAIQGPSGRVTIEPKVLRRTIEESTASALTAMIKLEDKVSRQNEAIRAQQSKIEDLTERVIRLETQLELLTSAAMTRPLPALWTPRFLFCTSVGMKNTVAFFTLWMHGASRRSSSARKARA